LCQQWKVKLIFRGAYRLSGTEIVERLEIIDEGCNLKQFDVLTWLTLTPIFYDRSTPLQIKCELCDKSITPSTASISTHNVPEKRRYFLRVRW